MAQVFKLQKVAQEFLDPMFFPSKALFVHSPRQVKELRLLFQLAEEEGTRGKPL